MPPEEVSRLMRDHPGQLRLVAHAQEQAREYDRESAREHHRVEVGNPRQIDAEVLCRRSADRADQVLQVPGELRVLDEQVGAGDLLLGPLHELPDARSRPFRWAGIRGRPAEPCPAAGAAPGLRPREASPRRPPPTSIERRVISRQRMHISASPVVGANLSLANGLARLHTAKQPIDHLRGPCGSAQVAELDAGHLAACDDDVEPDDLTGLQVHERRIIDLLSTADIGGAEADDAPRQPQHAERNPPARRDLVLGMQEERIIIAGLLARAARPADPASSRGPCLASSADSRPDICG